MSSPARATSRQGSLLSARRTEWTRSPSSTRRCNCLCPSAPAQVSSMARLGRTNYLLFALHFRSCPLFSPCRTFSNLPVLRDLKLTIDQLGSRDTLTGRHSLKPKFQVWCQAAWKHDVRQPNTSGRWPSTCTMVSYQGGNNQAAWHHTSSGRWTDTVDGLTPLERCQAVRHCSNGVIRFVCD